MPWNILQVTLFYSFHLRKSKVQRYLAFADLGNIFLIQSLLYFQRSPVTRHRRVTYGMQITLHPSLVTWVWAACGYLCSKIACAKKRKKKQQSLFNTRLQGCLSRSTQRRGERAVSAVKLVSLAFAASLRKCKRFFPFFFFFFVCLPRKGDHSRGNWG